jgi:FKBP-type peptidyl-prolyl cis-trans isomerase 2
MKIYNEDLFDEIKEKCVQESKRYCSRKFVQGVGRIIKELENKVITLNVETV